MIHSKTNSKRKTIQVENIFFFKEENTTLTLPYQTDHIRKRCSESKYRIHLTTKVEIWKHLILSDDPCVIVLETRKYTLFQFIFAKGKSI